MAKSKAPAPEKKSHPVKPGDVKPGHVMVFPYWGKVKRVDGPRLTVESLDGGIGEFQVQGEVLIASAGSADQVHETVPSTMTEIAERLISSHRRPLTVCFEKADGSERVLRGRLVDHEALLGRSRVEDLEQPAGDRLRLVDHRTLKWLVVDGVKYELKGK